MQLFYKIKYIYIYIYIKKKVSNCNIHFETPLKLSGAVSQNNCIKCLVVLSHLFSCVLVWMEQRNFHQTDFLEIFLLGVSNKVHWHSLTLFNIRQKCQAYMHSWSLAVIGHNLDSPSSLRRTRGQRNSFKIEALYSLWGTTPSLWYWWMSSHKSYSVPAVQKFLAPDCMGS
jgi:hypothetical protein